MKSFSHFLEATFSKAVQQATRMGLKSDGHAGYYDKSGEFVAKNVQGRLVFYNKRQIQGQDPGQTPKEKLLSAPTTINAPPISESELREKYIAGEIFKEGDIVESIVNGMIGTIIRRGANHLICVTEDEEMFKSWIKDVREYTEVKNIGKSNETTPLQQCINETRKKWTDKKEKERFLEKKDLEEELKCENGSLSSCSQKKVFPMLANTFEFYQ
jgi:hypothetical protein